MSSGENDDHTILPLPANNTILGGCDMTPDETIPDDIVPVIIDVHDTHNAPH